MKILLLFTLILSYGCMDLDSNLFEPNTDIEEYMLNGFEGEQEVTLPEGEFVVSEEMIHRLQIPYTDDAGNERFIHAVYVGDTSKIGSDSIMLYFHGNSGNIDFYWNRVRLLAHIGKKHRFGVLVIDYPGYGLSEGEATIDNLLSASRASGEWLVNKGMKAGQLYIYGFSLGSIPALQTPLLTEPGEGSAALTNKIILEAPIGSIQTMVEDASGLSFDASFFTSYHDNSNIEAVKDIEQPLLLIHGTDDSFLSIETHGKAVRDAYQGRELIFKAVENGKHSDVPEVMGFEEYLKLLENFIEA